MERSVFSANMLIVEAGFRRRDHEVVIDFRLDPEIAIDRSVSEFDFQRLEAPAIADGSDCGGLNGFTFDAGSNARIGLRQGISRSRGDEKEKARAQRKGGTPHGFLVPKARPIVER
jgi:hypothetical protein